MNNEKIIKNLIINYCEEDKFKFKKYDKKNIRNELKIYYASYSKLINRYIREKNFRINNGKKGVNVKSLLKLGLELNPKEFLNDICNFYNKYKPNTDHLTILGILVKNYVLFNDEDSILTLKKLLENKKIDFNNLIGKTICVFKTKIKKGSLSWKKCLILEKDLNYLPKINEPCLETENIKNHKISNNIEINNDYKSLSLNESNEIKNINSKAQFKTIKEIILNNIRKDDVNVLTIYNAINNYLDKTSDQQLLGSISRFIHSEMSKEKQFGKTWLFLLELGLKIKPKYFIKDILLDYYNDNNLETLSNRINSIDWNEENLNSILYLMDKYRIPNLILDLLKKSPKRRLVKFKLKQRYDKDFLKEEYEYFIKDEKANLTKKNEIPTTPNVIKENNFPLEYKNDNIDFENNNINKKIEEVENKNTESIESNIENENLKEESKNNNEFPRLRNALHCSPLSQQADSSPAICGGASSVRNVDSKSNESSKLDVEATEDSNDKGNTKETISTDNTKYLENNEVNYNISNLENNLEKAGVCESECKPFASYLIAAYMNRIPILLAGPCGEQIANAFSTSVCGAMSYVFDCKKVYNTTLVDDMLKSENEVVILKHPFAADWRETILELLAEGEKFYILINPFYEDLQIEPMSLYNFVIPFITELIIDKPPVFEALEPTKIELPEPTNKLMPLHNEMLKEMKLSPYCINQIQTFLSEMHHILDNNSKVIDYKYVLFPYAYVTNQGDCIAKKWLEVSKEAERYISKYFNIKI